jgi:hypothetical protein
LGNGFGLLVNNGNSFLNCWLQTRKEEVNSLRPTSFSKAENSGTNIEALLKDGFPLFGSNRTNLDRIIILTFC